MEQSIEEKASDLINGVLSKYLEDENIPSDRFVSKIKIRLVSNIFDTIKLLRPDLWEKYEQSKEEIEKCSGYALPIEKDSFAVLIDKAFFLNSVQRNFIWVEVLLHELTHAFDYINNKGIMGHDSFDSMLYCLPFWYWTEFHAKYKGTFYMLNYVMRLSDEYKRQYENEVSNTVDRVTDIMVSNSLVETKRYNFMNLLGELAAYREVGFSVPNEKINCLFPDFIEFTDFLKTKDKTVDPNFLTILNYGLKNLK